MNKWEVNLVKWLMEYCRFHPPEPPPPPHIEFDVGPTQWKTPPQEK